MALQALCINKDVLKLRQPSRINEKCLDLQKPVKGAAKVMSPPWKLKLWLNQSAAGRPAAI